MENDLRSVNAKANAGMATGITALGIEAAGLLSRNGGLNGMLGGLFGNGSQNVDAAALISALSAMQNRGAAGADAAAIMAMVPALVAAVTAAEKGGCTCNEDHVVNRYEAAQQARIAELETEEGKEFLSVPEIQCKCWRIEEGEKRTLFITYYDTQLNKENLKARGHSAEAVVSLLFTADKQTKTLTPSGWN